MSQNNKNFNIFKNGQPDILESATHETSVSHSQESYENQANKISPKENLARRGRSNLKSPERTPGSLKRLRSERSVSPSVSENGSFCESEVSFCMSSYESRRRKNAPIRIAIEGNIAAGKSTFIKILEDISMDDPNCNWFIQPEPLEKWTKEKQSSLNDSSSSLKTPEKTSRQAQNTSLSPLQALSQPTESQKRTQRRSTQGGNNLLEKFYKDPQRWAYTFEAYTFMTRMKQALDADRQVKKEFGNEFSQENNNFSAITFFERSVYSSRLVFAENCYESGVLSSIEWSIYCDWSNYLIKTVKELKLDGIIYLRCDPQVCIERMKKRSRSEENSVPSEYLEALHAKHDTWLNDWMSKHHYLSNTSPVNQTVMDRVTRKIMDNTHQQVKRALQDVPVLVVNCSDEFENNSENREKMLNTVRDFLRKIEFFDEHELEKIQEHTREPAFSESTTVSRSQSLVEMDKENLDPKHVTEKSQKIADTAVENSTKPVVCSGDI